MTRGWWTDTRSACASKSFVGYPRSAITWSSSVCAAPTEPAGSSMNRSWMARHCSEYRARAASGSGRMSSWSRRWARSSRFCSAFRRSSDASTARSYSGPKRPRKFSVRRRRVTATAARTTTTRTTISSTQTQGCMAAPPSATAGDGRHRRPRAGMRYPSGGSPMPDSPGRMTSAFRGVPGLSPQGPRHAVAALDDEPLEGGLPGLGEPALRALEQLGRGQLRRVEPDGDLGRHLVRAALPHRDQRGEVRLDIRLQQAEVVDPSEAADDGLLHRVRQL